TSAAAQPRRSRSSCARAPSGYWRTRHASPGRVPGGSRMASASISCRPSTARRRPTLNTWFSRACSSQPGAGSEGEGRDVSDHAADLATEIFVAHRNLLFTVAYEMLGSAADAEDVLQETWLRWVTVDPGQVRDERAYLVQ